MQSTLLDTLARTLHDFDLVEIYHSQAGLTMGFICVWNEMFDEKNPKMRFEFTFSNSTVVDYSLFKGEGVEIHNVGADASKSEFGPLLESDVYVNSFRFEEPCYLLSCNANEETYAELKVLFGNDSPMIVQNGQQQVSVNDYLALHEKWWEFVWR